MTPEKKRPGHRANGAEPKNSLGSLNSSNDNEADRDRQEFVVASLRSASLRVRLIANEIDTAGVALKGGLITPEAALEWVNEAAPGCVGYLPAAFEGQAA